MKRLLLALLGFWALLVGVTVLLAVYTDDAPPPKEKPPGPMTCASLQKRAEKCADGLAELGAELYAVYARAQGESEFAIGAKQPIVGTVVFGAISEKKVARYCKRLWASKDARIKKAKAGLTTCFARPGCDPFVDCVRELAKRIDFTSL